MQRSNDYTGDLGRLDRC